MRQATMHHRQLLLALLVFGLLAVLTVVPILAQTGGGYDLTWNTIDGGGGTSSGSGYTLSGAIGQPDAGALSGGSYLLEGGFWGEISELAPSQPVYLPLIVKQ